MTSTSFLELQLQHNHTLTHLSQRIDCGTCLELVGRLSLRASLTGTMHK